MLKKILAILLSLATVVIIVMAAMEPRCGLWKYSKINFTEVLTATADTTAVDSVSKGDPLTINIEPVTDTTKIDI